MAQLISIPGIGRTALIHQDGFYAIHDSKGSPVTRLEWLKEGEIIELHGEGCIVHLGGRNQGVNTKTHIRPGVNWGLICWVLISLSAGLLFWAAVYFKM